MLPDVCVALLLARRALLLLHLEVCCVWRYPAGLPGHAPVGNRAWSAPVRQPLSSDVSRRGSGVPSWLVAVGSVTSLLCRRMRRSLVLPGCGTFHRGIMGQSAAAGAEHSRLTLRTANVQLPLAV